LIVFKQTKFFGNIMWGIERVEAIRQLTESVGKSGKLLTLPRARSRLRAETRNSYYPRQRLLNNYV